MQLKSRRKLPKTPDILDARESRELYIVYHSYFEFPLYQEWLFHKNMHASNTRLLEKKLATWFVEILVILSSYWYESFFFEFISPYQTFYVDPNKKVMCADFYGCCYATESDGSIVKQKKESNSFDPVLIPPEFAKGKLKLENAGFDDIDAFIPSMIWLAAAQVYFFAAGSPPTYDQMGEKYNLMLSPNLDPYSRHFKRFLRLCLEHEMENRFADFEQCRESRWVRMNFACKVVDSPQQMREKYKKTIVPWFAHHQRGHSVDDSNFEDLLIKVDTNTNPNTNISANTNIYTNTNSDTNTDVNSNIDTNSDIYANIDTRADINNNINTDSNSDTKIITKIFDDEKKNVNSINSNT
ncbi:uncharacterized protein LOC142338092 [Convolutriloba macropyga]|uniref:uncharacterized protein LOC142338092 n=1 Tax=Convolutriloba macropyga TaxID=536237 RepID=UPI003F51C388